VTAALLPLWVAIPVAIFGAVGTVAGTILTIINLEEAVSRLRHGAKKLAMKVRHQPANNKPG
jgi:hypothetical protein